MLAHCSKVHVGVDDTVRRTALMSVYPIAITVWPHSQVQGGVPPLPRPEPENKAS